MELSVDAHRAWAEVPHRIRAGDILPDPWEGLFGTLRSARSAGGCMAVGQIGQSLDGRIATLSGHSRYINGSQGLCHLHRLRALVDAVVVGAGTVRADDPQLTVRHVAGPTPVRARAPTSRSRTASSRSPCPTQRAFSRRPRSSTPCRRAACAAC
jgi:hypothetical protein